MEKTKFAFGDISKLAEASGVSPQRICDYLSGRLTCPFDKAGRLAKAAKDVLGIESRLIDWIWPKTTDVTILKEYYENHRRKDGSEK